MSKFKISQSALKSFFDTSVCDLKWEEMYLNGYRTEPSAAVLDGLVFEQHVYSALFSACLVFVCICV